MSRRAGTRRARARRRGAALVIVLVTMAPVLLLGISAARLALQGERISRSERDRVIALQAAEAALLDAEHDIQNSSHANTRSSLFHSTSAEGFTEGCGAGENNRHLGLCLRTPEGSVPAWLAVDLAESGRSVTRSVPYGRFTGAVLPAGEGSLPARPPRYIIELLPYRKPGASAEQAGRTYFYRVTAIGFGARPDTRVVLQSFYRKEGGKQSAPSPATR